MRFLCPLCKKSNINTYHRGKTREYLECGTCKLVFVPKKFHLNKTEEKAQYDLHENNPGDMSYRKFLSKLFKPLNSLMKPNSYGLDFGSGPGPTLNLMFAEVGHRVEDFD